MVADPLVDAPAPLEVDGRPLAPHRPPRPVAQAGGSETVCGSEGRAHHVPTAASGE